MRRILGAMTGPTRDPEKARVAMVEHQLRDRGVTDERVLAAMGAIPREAFVPDASRRDAYADGALPIESGQTISQPLMVAKMTERLEVQPGDRILEIGTGSGYQAAILAWLGADVTSLERQSALIPLARERLEALAPDLPARSRSARRTAASAMRKEPHGTGSSSPRPRRPSRRSCAISCAMAAGWSSLSGHATVRC